MVALTHTVSIKVCIADLNLSGAQSLASSLNSSGSEVATAVEIDVTSWESQAAAFSRAVSNLKRIDYVFAIAGIGERRFIPNDPDPTKTEFTKPDLKVLDADLNGVLYTIALAIQQFRRQEVGPDGFRGKSQYFHIFCPPFPLVPLLF